MSEDTRIAVLTLYGTSQPVGGVEVFNRQLQRALGGIEIFADSRGPSEDLRRVGLEQPYRALRATRLLLRRHRERPFHLIISNGVSGWPLTLTKPGVPLVQVYHFTMAGLAREALSLRGDRVTTGRLTAFFDRLAGVGKHVVAVSHRVLREVESIYGLKGRFIPNAVDTATFRPVDQATARNKLGLPPEAKIGVFVGRPEHAKGYDILLRVARRMPEVLFLAAGVPGGKQGNVRGIGRVPHGDMPLWYGASDFFFLPSRYEGFSFSLLEALSCDLPAVVSETAYPFPEEAEECGAVVRSDQVEDFVRGIRFVLEERGRFSPRKYVLPRYNFAVFRHTWQQLTDSLLHAGT